MLISVDFLNGFLSIFSKNHQNLIELSDSSDSIAILKRFLGAFEWCKDHENPIGKSAFEKSTLI